MNTEDVKISDNISKLLDGLLRGLVKGIHVDPTASLTQGTEGCKF